MSGSQKSIEAGCTCPATINNNGEGMKSANGDLFIVIDIACPLHGKKKEEHERDSFK